MTAGSTLPAPADDDVFGPKQPATKAMAKLHPAHQRPYQLASNPMEDSKGKAPRRRVGLGPKERSNVLVLAFEAFGHGRFS